MSAQEYDIRLAVSADVAALPDIERVAARVFTTYPGDLGIPEELYDRPNSIDTFNAAQRAGRLWVAKARNGELVGFALVMEIQGYAHLDELDVLPSHGRRGIGSALLAAVCTWARDTGHPAVTLRTFRDVPWNAPFYQKRGFRITESAELSAAHLQLEEAERSRGLRTDVRVTMVYEMD